MLYPSWYFLIALAAFVLVVVGYSWQSKRHFQEWERCDRWCSDNPYCAVRCLWRLLRPLLHICAWPVQLVLGFVVGLWGTFYAFLDRLGTRVCPSLWDRVKRCFAHLSSTCWYASASAVVQVDNVTETKVVARAARGRSPKVLRELAVQLQQQLTAGPPSDIGIPRGKVSNPAETARSYSSILGGAAPGTGAAQSALGSGQAWTPNSNDKSEWMQMDLGEDMMILGVVTQARRGSSECVTQFSVCYRTSSSKKWLDVPGTLEANCSGEEQVRCFFPGPVVGCHIRINPLQWHGRPSLRAGVLVASSCLEGAAAALELSTGFLDGWRPPFRELREAVCAELCGRICECSSSSSELDSEAAVFLSKEDVNLGKASSDAREFSREGVFQGAGKLERLALYVGLAERIGAKASHPKLSAAQPVLEAAVRERIRWGMSHGDPKALQFALLAAAALEQRQLMQVREAAQVYRERRGLPLDWDVLGMASENAYGFRMLQKVKLQGALFGTAPVPGSMAATLQALLDETFISKFTRDRRDGSAVPHRLVLVSATAVQNEQSWLEYVKRREQIREALQEQPLGPAESFGGAMPPSLLMRSDPVRKLPALDAEVQEAWLFHGTSKAGAEGITTEDFRISLAGSAAGTLYGRGVYLAEACTKSDEYTQEAALGTDRYLLLCRATLGRVYYTDESHVDPRELEQLCESGLFHTVLGDREKKRGTYREFIVYDDDQVYAAYIICYRRQVYNWKETVKK